MEVLKPILVIGDCRGYAVETLASVRTAVVVREDITNANTIARKPVLRHAKNVRLLAEKNAVSKNGTRQKRQAAVSVRPATPANNSAANRVPLRPSRIEVRILSHFALYFLTLFFVV